MATSGELSGHQGKPVTIDTDEQGLGSMGSPLPAAVLLRTRKSRAANAAADQGAARAEGSRAKRTNGIGPRSRGRSPHGVEDGGGQGPWERPNERTRIAVLCDPGQCWVVEDRRHAVVRRPGVVANGAPRGAVRRLRCDQQGRRDRVGATGTREVAISRPRRA